MELTDAQRIEAFHLTFLQTFLIGARKQRCVLKGGANLRYFFNSARYSNDIDLDVDAPESWDLERAVDGVLNSPALRRFLRTVDIEIEPDSINKPKQTPTTRRWRLGLANVAKPGGTLVRTKIEFSTRRDGSRDQILESVPDHVVLPYGLLAPTVIHYRLGAAIEQKVAALAERSETKARDVFDLDMLFRLRSAQANRRDLLVPKAEEAARRDLALSDEDFEIQVVPFLDDGVAALYGGDWRGVRERVAATLNSLGHGSVAP